MGKWEKYGALAAIAMAGLAAVSLLLDVVKGPPQIIVTVEDPSPTPVTSTPSQAEPAPAPQADPEAAAPEPPPAAPLDSNTAQTEAVATVRTPDSKPLALPASDVSDAETAGIWTDGHRFRVFEDTTTTVCPGATGFRFSVAKQGTQAAQAIYYRAAGSDQKAETGTEFLLAEGCQLRLERTGKTTDFFAEFTYMETTQ
jgi:hypothetical protein